MWFNFLGKCYAKKKHYLANFSSYKVTEVVKDIVKLRNFVWFNFAEMTMFAICLKFVYLSSYTVTLLWVVNITYYHIKNCFF